MKLPLSNRLSRNRIHWELVPTRKGTSSIYSRENFGTAVTYLRISLEKQTIPRILGGDWLTLVHIYYFNAAICLLRVTEPPEKVSEAGREISVNSVISHKLGSQWDYTCPHSIKKGRQKQETTQSSFLKLGMIRVIFIPQDISSFFPTIRVL